MITEVLYDQIHMYCLLTLVLTPRRKGGRRKKDVFFQIRKEEMILLFAFFEGRNKKKFSPPH